MPVDTTQLLADAQTLAQAVIDSKTAKDKADADQAVAAASAADEDTKASNAHTLAVQLIADANALDPKPTPPVGG